MLVYEQPTWFRILRSFRGTTLQRTWGRLGAAVTSSIVVTYLHTKYGWFDEDLTLAPFQLIGVALGIFLGFRNNTSFDRFWEGRKLWGQIVNSSRTATRLILATVGPSPVDDLVRARHKALVYRLIAYVHAVRQHLRRQNDLSELAALLPPEEIATLEAESNRPNAIMQHLSLLLREDVERGWLDRLHHVAIENELTALINSQGGCERIRTTPIPFAYTVLLHQTVAAYCFALPFGLVHSIGHLTPMVVLLVSYAFFGLDAVGDEVEEPFGEDPNDLPLMSISRTIEVNLRERLLEEEKPPFITPVKNRIH